MLSSTIIIRPMLILSMSLALSACSPEALFSSLATSELEQATQEQIEREQIVAAKLDRIKTKQDQADAHVFLISDSQDPIYQGVAFWHQDTKTLEFEIIAPDPSPQIYQVWVKAGNEIEFNRIGTLTPLAIDDYVLTTEYPVLSDLVLYVALQPEDSQQLDPNTIVLTGNLSHQSPQEP